LPISLKLIKARLQTSTYYTSLEAFKFDVHLIVQNAHAFTEPSSTVSRQADALEAFIIDSLEASAESSRSSSSEEEFITARSRRVSNPYAMRSASRVEAPTSSYQIRTRGMAKRERQSENDIERRTRRCRYA